MKVKMVPDLATVNEGVGGIHTAIRAYYALMPDYGVEFVANEQEADLVAIHAGSYYPQNGRKPVVQHCHGLHWTADYTADALEYETNADVIAVMRRAQSVIVPSNWVAQTIMRDMHMAPFVVGHGVHLEEFNPMLPHEGYVLWNKNRVGDVCNPQAVDFLARMFPDQAFVTTFLTTPVLPNITVTGLVLPEGMQTMVRRAQVYLSTTKETFGIGTLEALASGVPVLGFAEGGNLDLITHLKNGYLAKPGDYDDLVQGLTYCLAHREEMSDAARESAQAYSWRQTIPQIVGVYEDVVDSLADPAVSVVIPCYNYGDKLERAVKSVMKQTVPVAEVILVDNNSTDNTQEVMHKLSLAYTNVTFFNEPRQGVAYARNTGVDFTTSPYVCCLDADDEIAPSFVETCLAALLDDPALGIAYTGLRWVRRDGTKGLSPWPAEYDFDAFLKGQNQVPTCCVFRREVWERTGGYRQRYAPNGAGAEDAALWLKAGSLGFGARKVSAAPLFIYHVGDGLVSGDPNYQEEDWRAWYPWVYDGVHPFASLAKPDYVSHPVHQYDQPVVSVVIPVGKDHAALLFDALDSLEAQTYRDWEVIVALDQIPNEPEVFSRIRTAFPFMRVVYGEGKGAGHARNLGAKVAKGEFLLFLDADDWLEPNALEEMLLAWHLHQSIVYTDYYGHAYMDLDSARQADGEGRLVEYRSKQNLAKLRHYAAPFDQAKACAQPALDRFGNFYIWNLITSLVPKRWHEQVGGFDEALPSWEDWDYWLRFAKQCAPFFHVENPLVNYRFWTGNRREVGMTTAPQLIAYLENKYQGDEKMCCGQTTIQPPVAPPPGPASINMSVAPDMSATDYQMVRLVDGNEGEHPIVGPVTKTQYGYRRHGETFLMHVKDIAVLPHLEGQAMRKIEVLPAIVQTPAPSLDRSVNPPDNQKQGDERVKPNPIERMDGQPALTSLKALTPTQVKALYKLGILTVNDLLRTGEAELLKIKGIGPKSAAKIMEEATAILSNG